MIVRITLTRGSGGEDGAPSTNLSAKGGGCVADVPEAARLAGPS